MIRANKQHKEDGEIYVKPMSTKLLQILENLTQGWNCLN